MDISIDYQQMCKAAKEIQEIRAESFQDGDYYTWNSSISIYLTKINNPRERLQNYSTNFDKKIIWLPRQDQLQEIWNTSHTGISAAMNSSPIMFVNNLRVFISEKTLDWIKEHEDKASIRYTLPKTMEQWVLALVMKTLYNKRYDNITLRWRKL